MRDVAAWLLLGGTLLPPAGVLDGPASGDEIGARLYHDFNGVVLIGSLLIAGLCVVALARHRTHWTRAVASAVAWCLVWLDPLVVVLLAGAPLLGIVVARVRAVAGTAVFVLSVREQGAADRTS